MAERRIFTKGMDMDTVIEFIENGFYRNALNIHVGISDTGNAGTVENVKGNTPVFYDAKLAQIETDYFLPAGTLSSGSFRVIGSKEDAVNKRVVYFVKNSNVGTEYDRILEYSYVTNSIDVILIGNIPFNFYSSVALNFNIEYFITGINIVNNLLYWTDNINAPRKINIEDSKLGLSTFGASGYPFVTEETLHAIKYPPLKEPTIAIQTNTAIKKNNIIGKHFQFKYFYVKDDGEESCFSPISLINVPIGNEFNDPAVSTLPSQQIENNVIKVTVFSGSQLDVKIGIAVRLGNFGDFFQVAMLDKKELFIQNFIPYTYSFYNDKLLAPLELRKSVQLFDRVPRRSKAQEYCEGNRILYGNIFEDYNNIKDLDVTITPTYKSFEYLLGAQFQWNHTFHLEQSFHNFERGDNDVYANPNQTFSMTIDVLNGNVTAVGEGEPRSSGLMPVGVYSIGTARFEYNSVSTPNTTFFFSGGLIYIGLDGIGGNTFTISGATITPVGSPPQNYHFASSDHPFDDSDQVTFDVNISGSNMFLPNSTNISDYGGGQYFPQIGDVIIISGASDPVNYVLTAADVAGYYANQGYPLIYNLIQASGGALYGGIGAFAINSATLNSIQISRSLIKLGSFKSGAIHPFAIEYSDFAGREGTAVRKETFDIYAKTLPESRPGTGDYIQQIGMDWTINHIPPDWATHYQWLYQGNSSIQNFVQFGIKNIQHEATSTWLDLEPLSIYAGVYPQSIISYSFTKGDRIRFLTNDAHDAFPILLDVEVLSFGAPPVPVVPFGANGLQIQLISNSGISLTPAYKILVEIYTPKPTIEEGFYFEFDQWFPIINAGTANRAHGGQSQNQVVNNLISQQPATGHFERGDVWIRPRRMMLSVPTVPPNPPQPSYDIFDEYVEDYNISDFYVSNYWDKGRPNRVGATNQPINGNDEYREILRPTTIRYSDVYVPETNINGLSRFYDFNFESYDLNFASIQKLYAYQKKVDCYQELKVGMIPINEKIAFDGSNKAITLQSDNVLNPIVYYEGNYGIGTHPESFAVFENRRYFADVNHGFVVRLSNDGTTPISQLGRIHTFISSTFKEYQQSGNVFRLHGWYDKTFAQYHLMSELVVAKQIGTEIVDGLPQVLFAPFEPFNIGFNEPMNAWISFYDFHGEDVCEANQGFVSWKGGTLYVHNTNPLHNNFYGVQSRSEIIVISNQEPRLPKIYKGLSTESNIAWEVPQVFNNRGQDSNLIISDFEQIENIWYAPFWKDINTPNVLNPLIQGDELRDVIMMISLRNTDTGYARILAVNFNAIPSKKIL